jgi:hypothetical protein
MEYYSTKDIPDNHWSIQINNEFMVAILKLNKWNTYILVQLNPTDCRGYRLIVQLYDPIDMKSTFNRKWTLDEQLSLYFVASLLSEFYVELGCLPQIIFAGNNAMELLENGNLLVGRKEPYMLHLHIFGRGNPETCYFPNIPLHSPAIGEEFNLRGLGTSESYTKKEMWSEERINFKNSLQSFLFSRCAELTDVKINES